MKTLPIFVPVSPSFMMACGKLFTLFIHSMKTQARLLPLFLCNETLAKKKLTECVNADDTGIRDYLTGYW